MPETNNHNLARFYNKWVPNNFQSEQQGRPVGEYSPYIEIRAPGQPKQVVDRPIKPQDQLDYSREWMLFQAGQEQVADGTPLEEWPRMSHGDVLRLKSYGVHTIEACANMSDAAVIEVGHDGRRLQQEAAYFIKELGTVSSNASLRAENDALRTALQATERENAELNMMLEQLLEVPEAVPAPVAAPVAQPAPQPAPVAQPVPAAAPVEPQRPSLYPTNLGEPAPQPVVAAPPAMPDIPPPPPAMPEFNEAPTQFVPYAPHEVEVAPPTDFVEPTVEPTAEEIPEHMIGYPERKPPSQKQLDNLAKGRARLAEINAQKAAAARLGKQE